MTAISVMKETLDMAVFAGITAVEQIVEMRADDG